MEDGVSGDLELLYRGSRDGWEGSDCYYKCDNKGATITVIHSTGGFIFGGFSDKSWTSYGNYCESNKAFLFSLKIPSSEVRTANMYIKQDSCYCAMFHNYSYGPIFGSGNDLCITSNANNNNNSCSYLGDTYELPPGQTDTFLVGSKDFAVSEIEVFQVI